jgi:hypothetical protein
VGRQPLPAITSFRQFNVPSDVAQDLSELGVAAEVPPDEAKLIEWRAKAHDELRREFGDTVDVAVADARTLVAKDKRLHDYLDRPGLGSHPRVVALIANRARQLRLQGKL